MEEKSLKKSVFNELLTGGFVMGLLYSVQILGVYYLNGDDKYSWLFFMYGVGAMAYCQIYFGRRVASLKNSSGVGYSYLQALGFSLKIMLLSGVVAGFTGWLLQSVIDPQYGALLKRIYMEQVVVSQPNATDEQIKIIKNTADMMFTVWGQIFATMFTMLLNGGFVALITSAFVKRNPNIFVEHD